MKNILFIALLVFSVHAFAQDSGTKKNEIGINVFSIIDGRISETLKNNSDYTYEFYPTYLFATGIMYKRHWQKNALRVSLDYYYDKYEKRNAIWGPSELETTFRIVNRVGYQRTFGDKKIKPFLAIDLVMAAQKRYELYEGWLGIGTNEYTTYFYDIGLAPTVGLQYQITTWLSVSAEINAEFSGNLVYVNDKLQGDGFFVAFNPIRLFSVNYHL